LFSISAWIPFYMARTFHAGPKEVGGALALIFAITGLSAPLLSGWAADHLSSRDERWKQSFPDVSIATFGLTELAICTFSLRISRQVLTFLSEACIEFMPSIHRLPLGQYAACLPSSSRR